MPPGRRPLILAALVAAAAFSLLAAGCGGSGAPGVASVASSASAATTATPGGAVAFTRCMRSNGVPAFPDPSALQALGASGHKPTPQQLGVSESQLHAAASACDHLLPDSGEAQGQTITPADHADYLRGAACMRSHGLAGFPDPRFQNNNVTFDIPSNIDTSSSQFKSALAACDGLIPAGLPYSSPGAP